MDQLKQYSAVAWKYHFWILSFLITVLFLVVWVMSTFQIRTETETLKKKWEAAYSSANDVLGKPDHPNTESAKKVNDLIQVEAEQVRLAWGRRFKEQENVLVWPEELLPDFIAKVEPLKPIELKVPFDPDNPTGPLTPQLCERYRNYIEAELPKLAEIIGSVWSTRGGASGSGMGPDLGTGYGMGSGDDLGEETGLGYGMGMGEDMGMGGGGMMGSGGGMMGSGGLTGPRRADDKPIVVVWSSGNQSGLQASRFSWGGPPPTTLQILYAQEDLWVLRALMNIIKTTNGDADAQYNAAIKQIDYINLGADAGSLKDSGSLSGSMAGGMGGMGEYGSGEGMMGSGGEEELEASSSSGSGTGATSLPQPGEGGSGSFGSGMGSGAATSRFDPAENRYVNDQNEPLSGDDLRTSMQSTSPSDAFIAVAKRMPVRIHVQMNLLKLPVFLSNLANSELPVEVRQVRLTVTGGGGGSGSGGMGDGGMMGSGGDMMGSGGGPSSPLMGMSGGGAGAGASMGLPEDGMDEMGGMGGYDDPMGSGGGMMGSGGGMMGSGGGAASKASANPYDGSAEIYGIIYIYNPVDGAKIGLQEPDESDTSTAAGSSSADASTGTDATASTPAAAGSAAAPADTGATPPSPAAGTPPTPPSATPPADGSAATPAGAGGNSAPAPAAGTPTGAAPGAGTTPPAGGNAAGGATPPTSG